MMKVMEHIDTGTSITLYTGLFCSIILNDIYMTQETPKTSSRKKFLLWAAAITASAGVMKFLPGSKKNTTATTGPTVKMLTQDGRLVEVDQKLVASSKQKITTEELQQWIKK
jgi:hypothetical protein